jgi:predicted nucleic acid-binding protein
MKFLLDASAVVELIRILDEERTLRLLSENSVLDLTKYEVGNAIWKELVLQKAIQEKEFEEFLSLLRSIISRTNALSIDDTTLLEVGQLASKEKITFYDASYITIAEARNLTFVTEDRKLHRVASKHIKTTASKEIAP